MNSLNYFFAKHGFLSFLLVELIYGGFFTLIFIYLGAPLWLIIFYNLIFLLVAWASQNAAIGRILKPAVNAINNGCDPYPMIDCCEKLLSYKTDKNIRLNLVLYLSTALTSTGKIQEALKTVEDINIDASPAFTYDQKVLYYYYLSSFYYQLGFLDKGDFSKEKFEKLASGLKNQKKREFTENISCALNARACYAYEDYEKALEWRLKFSAIHQRHEVEMAFFEAETRLKLGDADNAKKNLIFVIQNGNRLAHVNMARELMAQTEKGA